METEKKKVKIEHEQEGIALLNMLSHFEKYYKGNGEFIVPKRELLEFFVSEPQESQHLHSIFEGIEFGAIEPFEPVKLQIIAKR